MKFKRLLMPVFVLGIMFTMAAMMVPVGCAMRQTATTAILAHLLQ